MIWEKVLSQAFIVALLASGVRLATPLLLAALGEIFAERSGVLNIGLEGLLLIGALFGFVGSYYGHSPWLGLLLGILAAGLVALLHAYVSITLGADQVVSGLAINLLAVGLATYVNRALFGISSMPSTAVRFREMPLPGLSAIPVLGEVLFQPPRVGLHRTGSGTHSVRVAVQDDIRPQRGCCGRGPVHCRCGGHQRAPREVSLCPHRRDAGRCGRCQPVAWPTQSFP